MALKASLATKADLDALAEPLRALYVEREGKFVLDAEGLVPASDLTDLKQKVGEFRTNNLALTGELEQLRPLKTKFDGVDPEEYKTLKAEKEKFVGKGVKGADDLQAVIDAAIAKANKPLVDELNATKAERAQARKEADDAKFRQLVSDDATKAGVKPQSMRHVFRDAEDKFELKDGALVPKPGVKHETPKEWLQDLAKSDDYLFAPSTGGGANGGNGHGGRAGAKQLVNPSPEEMGRHMEAIAKGEMVVVRQ